MAGERGEAWPRELCDTGRQAAQAGLVCAYVSAGTASHSQVLTVC